MEQLRERGEGQDGATERGERRSGHTLLRVEQLRERGEGQSGHALLSKGASLWLLYSYTTCVVKVLVIATHATRKEDPPPTHTISREYYNAAA